MIELTTIAFWQLVLSVAALFFYFGFMVHTLIDVVWVGAKGVAG